MEHLREKSPPPHLELVTADVNATGLPDAVADICLLSSILHEVEEPERLVREAARLLKPGGRLVVVDYRARDIGFFCKMPSWTGRDRHAANASRRRG